MASNLREMHRWAQIANPLISEANFFTSGLAVELMFKNVGGLVIEANFFSQSARISIVTTAVLIRKSLYVAVTMLLLVFKFIVGLYIACLNGSRFVAVTFFSAECRDMRCFYVF